MNLDGYAQTVDNLKSASRGSYGGPSISEAALRRTYGSVSGVDTGELRTGARLAAGSTQTAGVQQWLLPVLKFIGSLGAGMVVSEVAERAESWFASRNEAEEVAEATDRAADAIDTTLRESEQGAEAILAQLLMIIAELSTHLSMIDPQEHPEVFATVVQAGADIINEAAAMILGLCGDRDRAIEECYRALVDHGTQVCEKPGPVLADAAGGAMSGGSAVGSAAGASASAAAVGSAASSSSAAEKLVATPASVAEAVETVETVEEKPADKTPPKTELEQDCEEEAPVEEPEDCVVEKTTAEDTVEETREEAAECEEAAEPAAGHLRENIIGIVGVGLLIAGAGAIVHFLEQAVQEALADMIPGVEVPVAPEPQPEPAPEPVPEPVNHKKTAALLADVPEPPAKPIPATVQANYVADQAPAPPVVEESIYTPVGEHAGQPRVRKVGGWS